MADGYVESIENVENYLQEIKRILCAETFDIDRDFEVLMSRRKNIVTMTDLDYTKSDLRDTLLSLTVKDYSETLPDSFDDTSSPLYVFGNAVNTKELYIKIKIRDNESRRVFCLSFHYAEFPLLKPYSG